MNDLRFYDFNFNLLHIEHAYSSVYWELCYNQTGTFEGEFSAASRLSKICNENEYLVVCQGSFQGIITTRIIENGRLYIYGRTLNYLLEKKVILPFSTYNLSINKDGFSLAQYVINNTCGDFIEISPSPSGTSTKEFWRNTAHTALEVIRDCLERENAGHKIIFDVVNKKWIFKMYQGKELGYVLSDKNLNTYDSTYTHNILDYATNGYYFKNLSYKGEWSASANTPPLTDKNPENYGKCYLITESGTFNNINCKKGDYLICKSPDGSWETDSNGDGFWQYISDEKSGIYKWEAVLSATNEDEAKKELKKKKQTESADTKVKNLEFEKDFNLGDIVKFSMEIGGEDIVFNQRIDSVSVWFEAGKAMGVSPKFKQIT